MNEDGRVMLVWSDKVGALRQIVVITGTLSESSGFTWNNQSQVLAQVS